MLEAGKYMSTSRTLRSASLSVAHLHTSCTSAACFPTNMIKIMPTAYTHLQPFQQHRIHEKDTTKSSSATIPGLLTEVPTSHHWC